MTSPDPHPQWRSLEELEQSPGFKEWLEREFPPLASEWDDAISRRGFLKTMAASFALAGLGACTRQPLEKIVPYVQQPPEITPGRPLHFATAMTLGGFARGVVVESHEGRPVKVEGNPQHPASLGAADAFTQASILELYDPERSRAVTLDGNPATWSAFTGMLAARLRASGGKGLRILTERMTSPTLAAQMRQAQARFPDALWHQYDPLDATTLSARFARPRAIANLAEARVIISLDADFLGEGPASLVYARDFAKTRRIYSGNGKLSRLYVAEPGVSITGARADHRLPARAGDIEAIAREISMGLTAGFAGGDTPRERWIRNVISDLTASPGAGVVLAGELQPSEVHALAADINRKIGAPGRTIRYAASPDPMPRPLDELAEAMRAGEVDLLLILGGNPAYDAPADLDFPALLKSAPVTGHLSLYEDETSALCHWHVPMAHYLESWSDALAFDGTPSIVQPLIEPLFNGKSAHEVVAAVLGDTASSGYSVVRDHWLRRSGADDFDAFWQQSLRDGIVPSAPAASEESARPPGGRTAPPAATGLELVFRPDPSVHDGRFASNAWLQELPKPLSKITWDNAALFSPSTAARLGLKNGDIVELRRAGLSVRAPVFVQPGQADESIVVSLGYGRTVGSPVAIGHGFNSYALRTSDTFGFASDLQVERVGGSWPLATTQHHHAMHGRGLVRVGSQDEYLNHDLDEKSHAPAPDETLYDPSEFLAAENQWGMSIDLSTCIGCNACVIACQAENNIPVVGKTGVANGREMHWIRIDTYYEGDPAAPAVHFQPVPCMHCENAPCELVCPVAATVHDAEGLNVQVYNRCVGTRYCSNNCPYKVRRFNFLEYNGNVSETERFQKNPDVTVRSRGVMEKCTYCLQRISAARIEARKENRVIRDGEVVPACAQTCPAEAIVFGNIRDPRSRVSRLKALPLDYGLLAELNTRPRTTYLAKITNHP